MIDQTHPTTTDLPAKLAVTQEGRDRNIGLEIEFGGIGPTHAGELLRQEFHGSVEIQTRFSVELAGTEFGKIVVELDTRFINAADEESEAGKAVREALVDAATPIVPTEITVDPVSWRRVSDLDRIVAVLRKTRAAGTRGSIAHAFGVHLNVEAPRLDVDTLLAYLRAFILRADALREAIAPDATRKILPFIQQFPKDYAARVLDPDYAPDTEQFVRDYCAANPDKNRELDLLPILTWIDAESVADCLTGELPKARPAFHYRLPNTELDDPAWSISTEWQRWLAVETLVADSEQMARELDERSMDDGDAISRLVDNLRQYWSRS